MTAPSTSPATTPDSAGGPSQPGGGAGGAAAAALPVVGSLSPSRAGDFMTCPLLYRFRTIDRLPEPPSPQATRGTLVHAALERLFDLPAAERTPQRAAALLEPAWAALQADDPELAGLFADHEELAAWLTSARALLETYFELEDPRRLEPASREQLVEVLLDGGLRLRGIVDRLDVAPTGDVRVVDYKGLALDTPLPTPTGWTTMGEVEVGDQLLGADGHPCTVVGKSEVHDRPCYEVLFTDGCRIVCDNVHLWSVHLPSASHQRYRQRVLTTQQLAEWAAARAETKRGRRRPYVRATEPLELPSAELPIDPWLLGAWLGDGATRDGSLTIGHGDRDDMLSLLKEHWPGEVVISRSSEQATALTVHLARPRPDLCPYGHADWRPPDPATGRSRRCSLERAHAGQGRWNASFSELLSRQGLSGHEHVPPTYLRASRGQRLALLQGLMDTAGSWSDTHNRAVYVTTLPALAHAVRELVGSLGGTSHMFTRRYRTARDERIVHMIGFRPRGYNPFRLPRKALRVDAWSRGRAPLRAGGHPREHRRTIASVTPVSSVPTQCVKVDSPDALYLCGQGLVPTHNTGRAPGEMFEAKALFQMKFYGLVLWRTRGVVPRLLQLMYLGDREVLRYSPDEADLLAVERKLLAIWQAIDRATRLRDFRPRPSRLCDWCAHQALCPAFGGTPPPWPERVPGPDELLPHQQSAARRAAGPAAVVPGQGCRQGDARGTLDSADSPADRSPV